MKILFLDDAEERHESMKEYGRNHTITHVRTAQEAILKLAVESFDLICLDHDLAYAQYGNKPVGIEEDGRLVALRIGRTWFSNRSEQYFPFNDHKGWIHIHSWNNPAAVEMEKILSEHGLGIRTSRHPFGPASMEKLILALENYRK